MPIDIQRATRDRANDLPLMGHNWVPGMHFALSLLGHPEADNCPFGLQMSSQTGFPSDEEGLVELDVGAKTSLRRGDLQSAGKFLA